MTCRERRVRCDKERPTCKKCSRLLKECRWQPFVPRKEQKLRQRELREQQTPIVIAPSVTGFRLTSNGINVFNEAEQTMDLGSPSSNHWFSPAEPGLPLLDAFLNYGVDGTTSNFMDVSGTSDIWPHEHLILQNLVAQPALVAQVDDLPISNAPNCSVENAPYPLILSKLEQEAVDHYKTRLSLTFTTKDPTWSTQQIYNRLGAQDPLILHFLLAISLRDLHCRIEANRNLQALAHSHFLKGIGRLVTSIEENSPYHLNIMAGFWFLYMLGSSTIHGRLGTMLLSHTVRDYVQRHIADILCLDAPADQQPSPRADQALLARVTIWMFYADVGFCFCYRGGQLARYLCTNTENISNMVSIARTILELNFGQAYPADQAVDDYYNFEVLDVLWKSAILCQSVNDLDQKLPVDEMEKQFLSIERAYSSIFQKVTSDINPRPRFLVNADWIVSYFYAIRIYHFRYTTSNQDRDFRPKSIKRALKAILAIAQRVFEKGDEQHYERLHWQLFMAGLETSDPIHREWILEKFSAGKFKSVLERLLKIQHLSRCRVGMSLIREMCSEEEDAPRVTFLGF